MTSSDIDLNKIPTELKQISLKMQQLLERKKLLCVFQELRNRAEFEHTEEAASYQHEIDSIDDKLNQMSERIAELHKTYNSFLGANENENSMKQVTSTPNSPTSSGLNIFYVEPPPNIPAPTVILDVEKLPPHPCRTQCPECQQFIMTETFTSVSSVTWLVCLMTALIGCVAGCCLIPFCCDRFKSITHRCPKCRTAIKTIKKL
ncbi:lipopolysaccharide-induced tumor necrosis factor-alpha factor homolog [Channa argus]|uniref:lipopolysaccharide-induced tumor necrosis factor-alpha factor homolog n=1 Tax=Channa argus TaxID=215402 RepID=UPI0035216724